MGVVEGGGVVVVVPPPPEVVGGGVVVVVPPPPVEMGASLTIIETSSIAVAALLSVTVRRKTEVPEARSVIVVLAEAGAVIVPEPETRVQAYETMEPSGSVPLPERVTEFAGKVIDWSPPALGIGVMLGMEVVLKLWSGLVAVLFEASFEMTR